MATDLIPITATRAVGEVTVHTDGGVEDVTAQVLLLVGSTANPDFRDLSIHVTPLNQWAAESWYVDTFAKNANTGWFTFKLHNLTPSFNGPLDGLFLVEVERKQV